MKPVFQTLFHAARPFNDTDRRPGNCVQACVASIFEMDLDDVPHFVELTLAHPKGGHACWYLLCDWSEETLGLSWATLLPDELEGVEWTGDPGHVIAAGTSPRGTSHVCVANHLGEIVHDPRPEGGGLDAIVDYWVPCQIPKAIPAESSEREESIR